ncbi:MAG: fatty acid desaturase [Candidatus Melainabacteria bacterium]|nr:fatty acid desaturase [Candidatus Melainabacteria bacterium]
MSNVARSVDNPIAALEHSIRLSVSPEQLRSWMRPRPIKVIVDLVLNWAGIILAFYLMGHFQSIPVYCLGAVWIGLRLYALFIMGHDGAHFCLNQNHKINDWILRWFILGPMGMELEDGRRNHLLHHKTVGTAADPDRYIHSLSNKNSVSDFLLFCSGLATFKRTVLKITRLPEASSDGSEKLPKAVALKHFLKQRIPIFVTQPIIILAFWLFNIPIWLYPVLWVAPVYFGVFLPDEIRAFCDHAVAVIPDEAADQSRLVSFHTSWFEAMFYSPYNMNYHAEHHIWPGVPYYNRQEVYKFLKSHPSVTYRSSYTMFLVELLSKLPIQAKAPE